MMLGINRMVNGSLLVWRKMKRGCGGKLILHVIILGATRKLIKNYNWLWLLLIVTRAFLQTLLRGKKAKTLSRLNTGTRRYWCILKVTQMQFKKDKTDIVSSRLAICVQWLIFYMWISFFSPCFLPCLAVQATCVLDEMCQAILIAQFHCWCTGSVGKNFTYTRSVDSYMLPTSAVTFLDCEPQELAELCC